MQGNVKWFNSKKGYGFIESQGKDYFFHISQVEENLELDKGDEVYFEVEQAPKGIKAVNISKIS